MSHTAISLKARRSRDFDEEEDEENGNNSNNKNNNDDDDDDRNGIYARIRRRRQRRYYDEDDDDDDDDNNGDSAIDDNIGRAADRVQARGIFNLFDGDDDDDEDEDTNGIFDDVLIPNPILDNIDPDGAAERFPELARDPKFWLDMVLFLAFLNFVSSIGPRNPIPDLPAILSQATLPPPGI